MERSELLHTVYFVKEVQFPHPGFDCSGGYRILLLVYIVLAIIYNRKRKIPAESKNIENVRRIA